LTPTVPGELGNYLLLGRIARGGMADLYLAEHLEALDQEQYFAVKVLLPKLAQRRKFVDMFRSEGRLGILLKHPNIVRTVEVGRDGPIHFLAMDYIDGQDLGRVLRAFRSVEAPVPIETSLYIVRQALKALSHAHNLRDHTGQPLNLVNRDVSPANVMIGYDGSVRLIDFGIAQALLDYRSQIGSIKGKVTYMSPEQVRGLALDARSDIFSLGTVFYQLLTSREPFQAPSEFEQMERVREASPKAAHEVNKRVDKELADIVACAMSKDPRHRYQSADEMSAAIEGYARRAGMSLSHEQLTEFMVTECADQRERILEDARLARRSLEDADENSEEEPVEEPPDNEDGEIEERVARTSGERPAIPQHRPLVRAANPRWLLPAVIVMVCLAIFLIVLVLVR
jgi:serine/threonine-protein kinase